VTPAEARTTPARGTVERNVPAAMWTEILHAEADLAEHINTWRGSLRTRIIGIGAKFGYEEQELVKRGLIEPPRPPAIAPLKGGH
jgi:hypothetical protein